MIHRITDWLRRFKFRPTFRTRPIVNGSWHDQWRLVNNATQKMEKENVKKMQDLFSVEPSN